MGRKLILQSFLRYDHFEENIFPCLEELFLRGQANFVLIFLDVVASLSLINSS